MLHDELKLHLQLRGLKPHTVGEYLRTLQSWFERDLQPTKTQVASWIYEPESQSLRRHRYLAINALCRMLVEEEELAQNPCTKIPMPKEHSKPQPALADEALKKLLATCEKDFLGIRDKAVLLVLASTGCRRSELSALLLADISVDSSQLIIRNGKNNTWRVAYLDVEAKKALLRYMRMRNSTVPELFVSQQLKAMTSRAIKQMIERRAKAANVEATAHMFRRRMATKWLLGGGSAIGLMNAAGWTTVSMPARYTAVAAQEIAQREFERMQ